MGGGGGVGPRSPGFRFAPSPPSLSGEETRFTRAVLGLAFSAGA